MSTSVTGRVVDENSAGIAQLPVVVRYESLLFANDIGTATTDGSGNFTVSIPDDSQTDLPGSRKLGVYVFTPGRRRQLYSKDYDDTTEATLTVDTITLHKADVTGWLVTLPGTTNALPLRAGNALRALVDDEVAWQHVADAMVNAQKSIYVMQLEMDMPKEYDPAPPQEYPEIVLAFAAPFDPLNPRAVLGPYDYRPERVLLDAAKHGKQVLVMISKTDLNWLIIIADFVLLVIPFVIASLIAYQPAWAAWNAIFNAIFGGGPKGSAGAVADYFDVAVSNAKVIGFKTRMFSVVHAKAVLVDTVPDAVDNAEVIVLGSPFSQSYWDTTAHEVYEPRRGSCHGEPIPVHDVSLGVRGPAAADLQQQFVAHWNRDCDPNDKITASFPVPNAVTTTRTDEYLASVQLVRTVNESTLPGLDKGEQGVLEAYLRAIENATDYIYIENQYFTQRAIAEALVAALKDTNRPNLQVILMVNVVPDLPFYPSWQTSAFAQIRHDVGAGASRFGVFTAWSHAAPSSAHKRTKPVIMPNYLHTKTAIVDGKWATIGSANLDGASLDQFQILRPFQFGTFRNDELNYLVFSDIENCPHTDFVDDLRLRLWSEHLGLAKSDPKLDATTLSASHGWLKLWTDAATAKLQGLINDPTQIDPSKGRVLAYPPEAKSGASLLWGWPHPHKNFLETSKIGNQGIDLSKIDLVEQTTAFSFHDGKWSDQ